MGRPPLRIGEGSGERSTPPSPPPPWRGNRCYAPIRACPLLTTRAERYYYNLTVMHRRYCMGVKVKEKKKEKTRSRIPSFEEFLAILEKNRSHSTKEESIKSLKERIDAYEKRFKMTTLEFVERFDKGEFEVDSKYPDHELFIWRNYYRSYQELIEETKKDK
jgi:hypothetical protein